MRLTGDIRHGTLIILEAVHVQRFHGGYLLCIFRLSVSVYRPIAPGEIAITVYQFIFDIVGLPGRIISS